ncbi:hypothetical protein CVT24_003505 [Panaeolus cyanescens]|uniref:protein-tyrosine-phosphatase n=1 Tax=Panaeolus cyanescens TaxID=181874 RepID=A0A409Y7A0_9AGAR|nr:hypothetical protein CVT24_003505 [Panaeolus cyanescens]
MALPLDHHQLHLWLTNSNQILILDIRPHAAYTASRIPNALSLSVPSTLLKRPLFSLDRLADMLPSKVAKNKFNAWRTASRILVYDADTQIAAENSNITGLLKKFTADGFRGELAYLKGGFQIVWREMRNILDTNPPPVDTDAEDDDDPDNEKSTVLRTRQLPMSAFSLSSTTAMHLTAPVMRKPPLTMSGSTMNSASSNSQPYNPFFDTIRQNTELSQGITERIPLRLPLRVRRRISDLPFPWLQDIARKAARTLPSQRSLTDSSDSESEDPDDAINTTDVEEGKEALAMQFFKIELAEQRRLMGVMEYHSRESGQPIATLQQSSAPFPFSITAGVEKGAKNRYRHIWPFEHARVRLHQQRDNDDDYVNASYVQPLGTNKRYIATQGPLPSTFTDFWTLCWEQNVHVIVMLTREVEGAMVKCGTYWADSDFGPLHLRLISTEGDIPPQERPITAGFFAQTSNIPTSRSSHRKQPHPAGSQRRYRHHHHNNGTEIVKRVFELTHRGYPEAKPRRIIHLQYLEWPDMNVPDDPRGVLGLVKQVEEAVLETGKDDPAPTPQGIVSMNEVDEKTGIAKHALGSNSPVLLHCSAGVGRTGGFIAVDAILDAIRRDVRLGRSQPASSQVNDAMNLDPVERNPIASPSTNHSIRTTTVAPIQLSASGFSGHVPATPMEVDGPAPVPNDDFFTQTKANLGTEKWAESIRAQGRMNSDAPTLILQHPDAGSTGQGVDSTSSSLDGSSEFTNFNLSSQPRSSSSFETSLSGISSPSTGFAPGQDLVKASELLQNVLNNQQARLADQQRIRTQSAPSSNLPTLPTHVRSSCGDAETPMQLESATKSAHCIICPPSISSLNGNPSITLNPSQGVFSETEPPRSRSQSPSVPSAAPSADESSNPPSLQHPMPVTTRPLLSTSAASEDPSTKSFHYKQPRPLNGSKTPISLSSFDEPIWEVIQDMREQRMSLCQSLRQYVFVHAAIVEGTLMILDEERDIAGGLRPHDSHPTQCDADPTPSVSPTKRRSGKGSSRSRSTSSRRSRKGAHPYAMTDSGSVASSTSTGKRGASPTELLKEGKEGEVMLSKRPSVKRRLPGSAESVKENAHIHHHHVPNRITTSMSPGVGFSTSTRSLPS